MYVMKELVTPPHCFMPICNIGEEGELGRVFFLHKKRREVRENIQSLLESYSKFSKPFKIN